MWVRNITIGTVTALAVVAGAAPAHATPPMPRDHVATVAHPADSKPVPQAPADAYRPGHPRTVGKPRPATGSAERPLTSGWQLAFSASQTTVWPTQYSTLTPTVVTNIGPTPYYLLIFDIGSSPNSTS